MTTTTELIQLLQEIRPEYGAVGSRDVDVTEKRKKIDAAIAALREAAPAPFQERVQLWMMECFGPEISADTKERNHRFLEEALELVQACGCTQSEAYQLVDYVFNRPVGVVEQEIGGVMVTLAALCLAQKADMHLCGDIELMRVWTKIEQIRAKQASKPKHSPLPIAPRERLMSDAPLVCPDHVAAAIRDTIITWQGPSLFNLAEEVYQLSVQSTKEEDK